MSGAADVKGGVSQLSEAKVAEILDELTDDHNPDVAWGAVTFAFYADLIDAAEYGRRTDALLPKDDEEEAA